MDILISKGSYGFGHVWTLEAYGKKFYLGQDSKFCSRVLGLSPRDITEAIGSNDLRLRSTRQKLARFVCDKLEVTRSTVNKIQPWDLAAD